MSRGVCRGPVADEDLGEPVTPSSRRQRSARRAVPRRQARGQRLRVALLTLGFTVVLGVLGATAAFAIGYAMTPIPDPNRMVTSNTSIVYYDDGETVLGSYAAQNRITVPLDQVPKHVQDAVLAAENRTFWTDPGISPTGIMRAAWADLRGGSTQGGSTITQQYVKNYYLSQEQTWTRKVRELFITVKLQRRMSKAEVLQSYLNTIYFGRGAYGIETAAQAYFDKGVAELTPEEGAVLAAVARAPSNYDPAVDEANLPRLQGRFDYVVDGMASMGALEPERARDAELPELAETGRNEQYAGFRGYLLAQVREELLDLGYSEQQIDAGGLRVTTTLNEKAQRAAVAAVEEGFPKENAKGVRAGLASIRPLTGELVAMYGGHDYLERSFNDATQARIEPGSTFKVFALAAALERDISLESRFVGDSGFKIEGGHKVNNEGDRDYGPSVDLLEATAHSINTAYVDLTVNVLGADKVVDAAVRAGVPEDSPGLDALPLVALGNASVAPVDIANAYATFAAGGVRTDWHTVAQVRTRTGEVEHEAEITREQVFDSDITADVSYALQQVVKRGSGDAARSVNRPVAGKTGNHEGITAWFAGYTPQLATAVGFYREDADGNRESLDGVGGMSAFTGGGYPTRIWADYMAAALKGQPVETFPRPARVGRERSTATETVPPTEGTETAGPDETEPGPDTTDSPDTPAPGPTTPDPTTPPEEPEPTEPPPPTETFPPEDPPTTEPPDDPPTAEPPPDEPRIPAPWPWGPAARPAAAPRANAGP